MKAVYTYLTVHLLCISKAWQGKNTPANAQALLLCIWKYNIYLFCCLPCLVIGFPTCGRCGGRRTFSRIIFPYRHPSLSFKNSLNRRHSLYFITGCVAGKGRWKLRFSRGRLILEPRCEIHRGVFPHPHNTAPGCPSPFATWRAVPQSTPVADKVALWETLMEPVVCISSLLLLISLLALVSSQLVSTWMCFIATEIFVAEKHSWQAMFTFAAVYHSIQLPL